MEFVKFNTYLTGLIHKNSFKKQFVFNLTELVRSGVQDPLDEEKHIKTKGLIHRYPDRVVLTVTNRCFAYCRFCFRKNNWKNFSGFELDGAINYLKNKKHVREVLISGGDPFTLSDKQIDDILFQLSNLNNIEVIRIGTRVFTSNPKRIKKETVDILKKHKSLWLAIHINHPDEITKEFKKAVDLIANSGIPIVSQTVLLKGINDDHRILKKLFYTLVKLRIKPYYLFGCDQALGNEKFRVPIEKSLDITRKLRGNISGLCMPFYAFDLPNGGGKIILEPQNILERKKNIYRIKNFEGKEFVYNDI